MAGMAKLLGVGAAGVLLWTVMDRISAVVSQGRYGLACLALAVLALGRMVADLVRGRGRRAGQAFPPCSTAAASAPARVQGRRTREPDPRAVPATSCGTAPGTRSSRGT